MLSSDGTERAVSVMGCPRQPMSEDEAESEGLEMMEDARARSHVYLGLEAEAGVHRPAVGRLRVFSGPLST